MRPTPPGPLLSILPASPGCPSLLGLGLFLRRSLGVIVLLALSSVPVIGQTYNFYGFSTNQLTVSSGTNSNIAPTPPSGTNFFRIGTGGGSILLTNSQIAPLGTNSQLRLIAPTGTSVNKASVFNFADASSTFYLKQFIAFGNTNYDGVATSGQFYLFTGDGGSFADGNPFTGNQSFSGLRFAISNTGDISITNRAGSGWAASPISGTGITQTNAFAIEIMGNNSASATNYNYGGIERSLNAYTFDLWVGGTLVASNLAKAQLANGNIIDSFMWYAETNAANSAALFLDSITYANGIATNSGRTFWTTNGAAAQSGTWGSLGTTGATVGWGATATISEGSPWVDNNTAVFSANSTYTVTVTNTVRAANLEFLAGNAFLTNGTVNLTFSNASVTVTNGVVATVASVLGGTNGLRKLGEGTLVLAGANTYTNGTLISAGTLQLGNGGTNGSLSTSSAITNNGVLAFNRSDSVSQGTQFSGGTLGGTGSLAQLGTGTLTLTASNSYSGGTTLSAGTLRAGNDAAFGSGTLALNGGTVASDSSTARTLANALSLGGDVTFGQASGGTGGLTFSSTATNNLGGATRTLTVLADTTLAGALGNGGITKEGSANLTLNNASSSFGSLTINAGAVIVSNNAVVTSLAGSGGLVLTNGTLTVNNASGSTFSGGVSGGGTLAKVGAGTLTLTGSAGHGGGTSISGGTLRVGAGGTSGAIAGSITNNALLVFNRSDAVTNSSAISGSGAVVVDGGGILTLAGTSSYAGSTTVTNSSTLNVSGSLASTVSVSSGSTLAGAGTVGGLVLQNGGTVSPGNSPGTLSITSNVTWNGGANYNWQIYDAAGVAGTGWDLISASGQLDLSALTVDSKFNINLWSLSAVGPDANGSAISFDNSVTNTWTILTAAGGITGLGTNSLASLFAVNVAPFNGAAGFANALGGGSFSVIQSGNNLQLQFTPGSEPIPEPGTYAAGLLLLLGAGWIIWRRRAGCPSASGASPVVG